jgi:hypothetical protein
VGSGAEIASNIIRATRGVPCALGDVEECVCPVVVSQKALDAGARDGIVAQRESREVTGA